MNATALVMRIASARDPAGCGCRADRAPSPSPLDEMPGLPTPQEAKLPVAIMSDLPTTARPQYTANEDGDLGLWSDISPSSLCSDQPVQPDGVFPEQHRPIVVDLAPFGAHGRVGPEVDLDMSFFKVPAGAGAPALLGSRAELGRPLLVIEGPVGAGKSALLSTLLRLSAADSLAVIAGPASPWSRPTPGMCAGLSKISAYPSLANPSLSAGLRDAPPARQERRRSRRRFLLDTASLLGLTRADARQWRRRLRNYLLAAWVALRGSAAQATARHRAYEPELAALTGSLTPTAPPTFAAA